MLTVPERAGPANPLAGSPPRPPMSARRTTTIDSSRPGGLDGECAVDARARDLVTGSTQEDALHHQQTFRATISPDRHLIAITADPPEPRLARLVGSYVGSGFRAAMAETLPDHAARQSLLYALLDDLPGANLVSGYAVQRGRAGTSVEVHRAPPSDDHVRASVDMCAGWANDATILVAFRQSKEIPAPLGPVAPVLERAGDDLSWHAITPLPDQSTRRRRRLDLMATGTSGAQRAFDSHFRDSYRDVHGEETVVHEYAVNGTLDDAVTRIDLIETEARVLPWVECPGAVGSSDRMAQMLLHTLRAQVRTEFTGTSTCTHLNDAFRFLSDLIPLEALLNP